MKNQSNVAAMLAALGLIVALLLSTTAFAGQKVDVCHVPPGNPANFHTITVSERAFSAHLAHGDFAGACNEICATLCDDGNACTIDDTGDCEQNGCPAMPEAVNCDDGNLCTADSCEPALGCMNTPEQGLACNDDLVCTSGDTCDDQGACVGTQVPNCCLTDGECSQDLCDQASCNTDLNECENNPVSCTPSDLCQVSVCDPNDGACAETPVACGAGETCNVDTGECEPEQPEQSACPCDQPGNFPVDYNSSFPATSCNLASNFYSATNADGYVINAYFGRWGTPYQCHIYNFSNGFSYKVNYNPNTAQDQACRAVVAAACP